ncbi:membrane associated rhomboid family serine protease [Paenibacillus sp. DS2015]|uniref:rhomboid family intramembrane serine protease n=1 Tax=Paenibacillus sp. DS2015 TaxID=3373917 RepID=UPI003D258B52
MIFVRYENWKSYLRFYPVTALMILINIVMFIVISIKGGLTFSNLVQFGGLTNDSAYSGELWRYVASMFLHSGFDHLLFNCFALLVFAPPLERLLGSWRYIILYFMSGIIGNIITMAYYSSIEAPHTWSVGASGAIYGVYGAFLYVALLQRNLIDESSRKTLYAMLMFGIVFSIVTPSVNWAAHFGGLVGGFFVYGLIIRLLKKH